MKRKIEETPLQVKSNKKLKSNHDLTVQYHNVMTQHEPISAKKPVPLLYKLHSAMLHANRVCVLGASNKASDIIKYNGWSALQHRHQLLGKYQNEVEIPFSARDATANIEYSQYHVKDGNPASGFFYKKRDWYYHIFPDVVNEINLTPYLADFDPLNSFNISGNNKCLLENALLINQMRFGNCGSRSILVASWLWKNSIGIHRIEVIQMSFDHDCVVVNRTGDEWNDGWVIDPWWGNEGIIYPASEFAEKLGEVQKYCQDQVSKMQNLGKISVIQGNKKITLGVLWNIQPEKDIYPTYSEYKSVEDYYYVRNIYPEDIIPDLEKLHGDHKQRFDTSLSELKALWANDPNTSLLFNVMTGSMEGVKYSLQKNADINCQNDQGYSPLLIAAQYGRIKIFRYLIENGADIHLRISANITALGLAVYAGCSDIVTLLLDHGADPNVPMDGRALYDIAIDEGNFEIAELLKPHSIQKNRTSIKFQPTRFFAHKIDCWEVGETLFIKRCPADLLKIPFR